MFAKLEVRGTVAIEYIIYLTWVIEYNSASSFYTLLPAYEDGTDRMFRNVGL